MILCKRDFRNQKFIKQPILNSKDVWLNFCQITIFQDSPWTNSFFLLDCYIIIFCYFYILTITVYRCNNITKRPLKIRTDWCVALVWESDISISYLDLAVKYLDQMISRNICLNDATNSNIFWTGEKMFQLRIWIKLFNLQSFNIIILITRNL